MEEILLPAEILAESPSKRDGITDEIEILHRIFGCELICECGILLKLPQVVTCTACNLLHRFYYRVSLKKFDAMTTAMGCFFLACKIEEKPKRIRDIVYAFYYLWKCRRKHQGQLELGGPIYNGWKQTLVTIERHILKELGFSFYVIDHAHKFLLFYVKLLNGDYNLAQTAWSYLNDSTRLDLCLRYKSEVIACAAIFLAARKIQLKLPVEGQSTWWQAFQIEKSHLDQVVTAILSLYSRQKIQWLEPLSSPVSGVHITHIEYTGLSFDTTASQKKDEPPSSCTTKREDEHDYYYRNDNDDDDEHPDDIKKYSRRRPSSSSGGSSRKKRHHHRRHHHHSRE
mmetsp:Transcript_7455/g.11141  ORF Transcript_7455/g.11141 Transcript_7455/m.11141 type:complete len:341 (+) Transcript_7455:62-1084(+)